MTEQTTLLENDIARLSENIAEQYAIDAHYFEDQSIKRGLRNADGTGVLIGVGSSPESHARPSRTERGGRAHFAEIRSRYEFTKISACNFACISQKFCRIQKKDCIIQKLYLHFARISCTMRETVCRRVLIHDGTDDAS